jgi:hypothetical protein
MNNNTILQPNQKQRNLFWGAVSNPTPGKRWIIVDYDGSAIVSATAYEYSKVWGLYVTGTENDIKLGIYRKIEEEYKDDEKNLNNFVDYGNCPLLNITYEDWVQSAVELTKKIIQQLSDEKNCTLVFLSSHDLWDMPKRLGDIYEKLGINPANYPPRTQVSEVEEIGKQKISKGEVREKAAIDAGYYVLAIRKEKKGYQLIRKCLCQAGTPLDVSKNNGKNQVKSLAVEPFLESPAHYDLIITKENKKGKPHTLVSVTRAETANKQLKLTATFEPLKEEPGWQIQGITSLRKLSNVKSIPPITIKSDRQPLQLAVLFDATIKEDHVEPLKAKLIAMVKNIAAANPSAKFGLAVYGDYSETFGEASFKVRSDIPADFRTAKEWDETFNDKAQRMQPVDFMSALDQGLARMELFPWEPAAEKHILLLFGSPPHPENNPRRAVFNLPFTPAQKNWRHQLEKFKDHYNINISAIHLPKAAKAVEIKEEIDYFCERLKAFNYKGEGIEQIEQIETGILKDSEATYRLEPDTYHIPVIREEQQ